MDIQNPPKPVPIPSYPRCFVCGNENPKGMGCRFVAEGDAVTSVFRTETWMVGYEKFIHGGIIAAVLDEALVWASYAKTGQFGVTAELTVRYLKPLPVGVDCKVEGRLIEEKGRIWICEGALALSDGTFAAKATGKLIPMKLT
jgi:uncharacterized protein (TIGR00369 family)